MWVIRFLDEYPKKSKDKDKDKDKKVKTIPELTISLKSFMLSPDNVNRHLGAVVTIAINKHETVNSFLEFEPPCQKTVFKGANKFKDVFVTQLIRQQGQIVDNSVYTAYFSNSAIATNNGDIELQALKYYREVTLVEDGIPLDDTELIEVNN